MRKLMLLVVAGALILGAFADIKVSDVKVFSGYPWKEVVIGYTITGSDANAHEIRLTAVDKSANRTYVAESESKLSALIGAGLTEGRHIMRWNAVAEGAKFSSTNVVFTVSVVELGVQLWENGPHWAECNVGASKPEETGYYFWWGDTVGYKRVGSRWDAVDGSKTSFSFDSSNCPTTNNSSDELMLFGYIDETRSLVAKYDAATQYLGVHWRMPTNGEWEDLFKNCDSTWSTRNGVAGRLVTGKGSYASKSIFLPVTGYGRSTELNWVESGSYWASTPFFVSDRAYCSRFSEDSLGERVDYSFRTDGHAVRPLRVPNK